MTRSVRAVSKSKEPQGVGRPLSVKVLLDCAVAVALVTFASLALRGVLGHDEQHPTSRPRPRPHQVAARRLLSNASFGGPP